MAKTYEYKIFKYLDDITEAYGESVQRVDGLKRNVKEVVRTIEFYSDDKYLSGNTDALGREKPFYNVGNYRVTTAKVATDVDVKDIKWEPDSLKDSVPAMLLNRELFKSLKEMNFSMTLNDMGETRPKYGHLLIKKYMDEGKLCIDVCEWVNMDFDPSAVMRGTLIETHHMYPSELIQKNDAWYSDEIMEAVKAHAKANKNRPAKIEVKEVTGEFSYSFDPEEEETEENDVKFKFMCFYIACVNNKKFLLYKEDIKNIRDKYRGLAWSKRGDGFGRGVWEEGFEAQVWTNDAVITAKNAYELHAKIVGVTDSQKVSGNAIVGVDHGHIFQLEKGATLDFKNMGSAKIPEFQALVQMWKEQFDRGASTYDANTGEQPPANTPYSQTALLNQVANSPFEYQREVWGIFLNEILNDWFFPYIKKKIMAEHYLTSEFDADELKIIDEAIQATIGNEMIEDQILAFDPKNPTPFPTMGDVDGINQQVTEGLKRYGNKREIKIPEKFLGIKGKITANITGELRNKTAVLQSLSQIGKDIISTFNPQTGKYAALEDPVLAKIYGQIIELSGVPLSSAQLRPGKAGPAGAPADLSAVAPTNGTRTPTAV